MTIDAVVLRELHAETWVFHSVKAALIWYRGQLAFALDLSQPLEAHSAAFNPAERDKDRATRAKIAYCLGTFDAGTDDRALVHANKVLDWELGFETQMQLAKRWSMGDVENLYATMDEARAIVSKRMRSHGLLGGT